MKRELFAGLSLLLAWSGTVAVAAPQPTVDITWDQNIKFGKYHNYVWVPEPAPQGVSAADYERLRSTIDRYLASRGFRKGPTGEFAIRFTSFGATRGHYEGSYQPGWSSVATLSIDIYDTTTKRPIWNGIEKAEVSSRLSDAELYKAVERLLNRFPPSHGCSHNPAETLITACPFDD